MTRWAKIPELTISWSSISRTLCTHGLVDHGCFLLWAAIYWSGSSLGMTAERDQVCWNLLTSIRICSQCIVCCIDSCCRRFSGWCYTVDLGIISSLAALAALRSTNLCLQYCCVPVCAASDKMPVGGHDSDPLCTCWGVFVAMIYCCGKEEEDDNEKIWEFIRNK